MRLIIPPKVMCRGAAAALTVLLGSVATTALAASDLSGRWNGTGVVNFASGDKEKARCKASVSRFGAGYAINASCATPSGRADQSATVKKTGANSYAGSFTNAQFGISGSISVTVNGDRLTAVMSAGSGGAVINFSR